MQWDTLKGNSGQVGDWLCTHLRNESLVTLIANTKSHVGEELSSFKRMSAEKSLQLQLQAS